jgi:hypothetical protein
MTASPSVPVSSPRRFRRRWLLLLIPIILLIAVGGFVAWAGTPWGPPMAEAEAALVSDDAVTVTRDRWLTFAPAQAEPITGYAFYPGGKVTAESYAPMARGLAEQGYLVVVMPMPLNLAIFYLDAAGDVIAAYPNVTHWAVGGHSLGGVAAANFAKNQTSVEGLVLLASLPQDSDDLSGRDDLAVTFIYASEDGLFTPDEYEKARTLLPPDTVYFEIEGGNHGQFGWYGDQQGDGTPSISREEQQAQIVSATAELLAKIEAA